MSSYRWARSRSAPGVINEVCHGWLRIRQRTRQRRGLCPAGPVRGPGGCPRQRRRGGDVEQALIGSCVLNDARPPALNRQDYGSLALFELFHKVAGPAAEGGQRLDILRNVKHRLPQIILSTLGAERPRLQCAARRQPLGSN